MATHNVSAGVVARDLVDIDRYPIDDLTSPGGRELLARCHADLAATGACQLTGSCVPRRSTSSPRRPPGSATKGS